MKKILLLCLCTLLMAAVLTGCGCDHVWKDANCETPKTCSECGETEGAPLGHVWNAATCDAAKTCEVCKKTEGQALSHTWLDATCEAPKTCETCKKTEGEALGHTWLDATTEAPKTCETCGATEGTPIEVDSRFNTAACQELFGTWQGVVEYDLEASGIDIEGKDYVIGLVISCTFQNDGTFSAHMEFEDTFVSMMREYTIEATYISLEAEGVARDQADDYMLMVFEMTIEEYVDSMIAELDFTSYFPDIEMVYYVEDGVIYSGEDWESEMNPLPWEIREGSLYAEDDGIEIELIKQ